MPNNQAYNPQVSTAPERVAAPVGLSVAAVVGGGASLLFSDDFSSGDLSKTANGFSWASVPTGDVQVIADTSNGGTHSLAFTFGPDADGADDSAEQRFSLSGTAGTGPDEVWIEYDWFVPSNYIHRFQSGTSHHKFFALFADDYNSNPQVVNELWRVSDTESSFRTICVGGSGSDR